MYIIKADTSTLYNTTPNPNISLMQHTAELYTAKNLKCFDENVDG